MIDKRLYSIFQKSSKTFFYSSLFFPTLTRRDVFALYGFVRKADNFVDSIPQDSNGFYSFKEKYYNALNGQISEDIIIDSFVDLLIRKDINPKLVDAFLNSMEMDMTKNSYYTLTETLNYIYGSAEVIGLMMVKILELDSKTIKYARYLGRSMQYINIIRDIAEDLNYKRSYFPLEEIEKYGLISLEYKHTKNKPENFKTFIKQQIKHYYNWQLNAEEGFKYLPKRYLIPIKTASEMYKWTAEQILKEPFVVYKQKVKPMITKILTKTIQNIIDPNKSSFTNLYYSLKKPILEKC